MSTKIINRKALINYTIYAVLLILSCAFFTKESGMVGMIPLCAVLPATSTVFYNKRRLTVFICALLCLFFNMMTEQDMKSAAARALLCAVFAYGGIFVKRLIVTSRLRQGAKRAAFAVSAVVLCGVIIVSYAALFGNLISAAFARADNIDYVKESYSEGFVFKNEFTYYDATDKSYITRVSFDDGRRQTADISYQEGMKLADITDGIRDYYGERLKEALRTEIYDAVNIENADLSVANFSEAARITPETVVQDVAGEATLRVKFKSAIDTKSDFADMCEKFVDSLYDAGVAFEEIEFVGGYAERDLYKLTLEYGDAGDLISITEEIAD